MPHGAPGDPHFVVSQRNFNPNDPPDDIVIVGYQSPDTPSSGTTRIFLSLDFSVWADVADADIEGHADSGDTMPSIFWVKRTATIRYGSVGTAALEFLTGNVADWNLASARVSPGGLGVTAACCSPRPKTASGCT